MDRGAMVRLQERRVSTTSTQRSSIHAASSSAPQTASSGPKAPFFPPSRLLVSTSLTGKEREAIGKEFSKAGLLSTKSTVRAFLRHLGQEPRSDEFDRILKLIGFRDQLPLSLEDILFIMEECKKSHAMVLASEDQETLEAFVALGGQPNGGGMADITPIVDASDEFRVRDELESMVTGEGTEVRDDNDGTRHTYVHFDHFQSIFSHIKFVFSGFGSSFKGIDVGTPRDADFSLSQDDPSAKKHRKSRTQFIEAIKNSGGPGTSARGSQLARTATASGGRTVHLARSVSGRGAGSNTSTPTSQALLDDDDDDEFFVDDDISPMYRAIDEAVAEHYRRMDERPPPTPRTEACLDGELDTTLTVMTPDGDLDVHREEDERPQHRSLTPVMVLRERRKQKKMIEDLGIDLDALVAERVAMARQSMMASPQKSKPVRRPASRSGKASPQPSAASPTKARPSSSASNSTGVSVVQRSLYTPLRSKTLGNPADDFVRGVATQLERETEREQRRMARGVHRAVEAARRKQRREERTRAAVASVRALHSERPDMNYVPMRRTLHLKINSDFTPEQRLTCVCAAYTDLVSAVASIVKPLPVGYFVKEVWVWRAADKSYIPVTTLDDVPNKATVRALVYSPPTNMKPLGAIARPTHAELAGPRSGGPKQAEPDDMGADPSSAEAKESEKPEEPAAKEAEAASAAPSESDDESPSNAMQTSAGDLPTL